MSLGVAMIASIFYPSIGGVQTHTLRLSQELRARGVEVLIVTRHHDSLPAYEEIGGVPTYRVGKGDRGKEVAALSYIGGALHVLAAQRHRYDILHAHEMVSPMTIGLLARAGVRKPLVINPHARGQAGDVATLAHRRPLTGRLRLAAARYWGDAFVSISHDIRDELCGIGIEEEALWDIPNGVDVNQFRPGDPEERGALRRSLNLPPGPLVVSTGRLSSVKGLDVLLDAWPRVLQAVPEAHLLLVGDGEERRALQDQALKSGIARFLIFAGSQSDVAPYLRAADVFAMPSRSEGLPVSLLEAMATGLPIVASGVGGLLQVLNDGVTGRFAAVDDPESLADGVSEACTTPDAQRWGVRARREVARLYSLDAVAERYIQMYETLLRADTGRSVVPSPTRRI